MTGQDASSLSRRILHRAPLIIAGAAILAVYLPAIADLPLAGSAMLIATVLYAGCLAVAPRAWLLALPVLTVTLDLAPWTGRFLFSEFDGLVATTIAVSAIMGRYTLPRHGIPLLALLALLYAVLYVACLDSIQAFWQPPGMERENPYYSTAYSYKVGKGLLWALLLAPLWVAQYRKDQRSTLWASGAGVLLASLALAFIALWERGTIATLFSEASLWQKGHALLNFESDYRVTGIFADMHTGGEVIDGILMLLLPLTLGILVISHSPAARVCAGVAALALCYVVVVGFTRATYATSLLAIAGGLLAYPLSRGGGAGCTMRELLRPSLIFLLMLIACQVVFPLAGTTSLLGLVLLVVGSGACWLLPVASRQRLAALTVLLAACTALVVDAHIDSRYASSTPTSIVQLVVIALLLGAAVHWLVPRPTRGNSANFLTLVLVLAVLPAGLTLAGGNYRIGERMQTAGADLDSRSNHWLRVIESADTSAAARWFGTGVGSFPARYIAAYPQTVASVGSYAITPADGGFLSLGTGDALTLTQRINVQPRTNYGLSVRLISEGPVRLRVRICEHNQQYFTNWPGHCTGSKRGIPTSNHAPDERGFTLVTGTLEMGGIGELPAWQRKPVSIQLNNLGDEALIIDSVDLRGPGLSELRNADFTAGMDHWFTFNESHLPWHVKNLWLQAWFETGYAGLFLLVTVFLLGGWRALKYRHSHPVMMYLWLALACVMVFGAFGSPLDSARVSLWFYLMLFVLAFMPASTAPSVPPAPGAGSATS